ncbi:uncharacterized protein [Venturia canescens]|uniref:uncharacterized protein n=1 Tax=Venturia canescens TaxID=32260 RepID=UPI001C9D2DA1|nr:uncharacterized protein LOC122408395 [Venturia canescens]
MYIKESLRGRGAQYRSKMQAAGMLRGTGAMGEFHVLLIGTLILAFIGENAHALPLQVLPNIPGYIPVYIRHGDQPLDEINPALAEAFHEKQILENTPPERFGNAPDDLRKNMENHPSYDDEEDGDEGGLNAGSRRKGTVYLIGVRQSGDDKTNDGNSRSKIALPFEVLQREAIEVNSADHDEPEKSKDVWIEEAGKQNSARKPIGLSKEAVIKAGGLPVDLKDLERLAAEVEREETRPNDLYDAVVAEDRPVHSYRRTMKKKLIDGEATKERKDFERIIDDADDRLILPIEDPKEKHSSKSRTSERMLRPARDPKESRPSDESIDFMVQEE